MNNRGTGTKYEMLAAEYLRDRGYGILEQNFRCRYGEIDIIAERNGVLVFLEVKYRGSACCGTPLEAVDARKQRRISRAAMYYYAGHGYGEERPCRFDAIGIDGSGTVVHVENAFEFQGWR